MLAAALIPVRRWRCDVTTLPPLPRVELALRQATELFAAELLHPSSHSPDWSQFEWSMARAAAVLHGVTPLLAGTLRWRGAREWEQCVSEQRIHTVIRQHRIAALLTRIDEEACRTGIAVVPLKGAALHRLGLYSIGERPMADVDLLVSERDSGRMKQLLLAVGYLDTSVSWRHREFVPTQQAIAIVRKAAVSFGEHADRPIKIDLHTRIAERLPLNTVDVSELIFPPAPRAGLNCYPSTLALFTHLLLHAAGAMVVRALRLIQLHDLALVAARMRADEWAQLLAIGRQNRALWWAVPPLELLARYYPQAVPTAVLAALRPHCPRALRGVSRRQTLSEVSFSTLRIEAFPGMAWSTSISEKFSYALARAIPSRELLDKRVAVRSQQAWAADDSWSEMSHPRRILKWLSGHPPRPPAMHAVRTALKDPANVAAPRPPKRDQTRAAARMP
jgi:hypothetical protein